ncbi:MAG: DUF6483 family protein [Bacillota bacterium]
MIEHDWFMRQIQMLVQFVARLVFGKDAIEYVVHDRDHPTASDLIHAELLRLIERNEFCKAEDYLFANFSPDNEEHLKIALDFYQRLDQFDDDILEKNSFPREEIAQGLRELLNRSRLSAYGLFDSLDAIPADTNKPEGHV